MVDNQGMSEPTYRIELEHQPQWAHEPWHVIVKRISDDTLVWVSDALTREDAVTLGQAAIVRMHRQRPSETVYATETGDLL